MSNRLSELSLIKNELENKMRTMPSINSYGVDETGSYFIIRNIRYRFGVCRVRWGIRDDDGTLNIDNSGSNTLVIMLFQDRFFDSPTKMLKADDFTAHVIFRFGGFEKPAMIEHEVDDRDNPDIGYTLRLEMLIPIPKSLKDHKKWTPNIVNGLRKAVNFLQVSSHIKYDNVDSDAPKQIINNLAAYIELSTNLRVRHVNNGFEILGLGKTYHCTNSFDEQLTIGKFKLDPRTDIIITSDDFVGNGCCGDGNFVAVRLMAKKDMPQNTDEKTVISAKGIDVYTERNRYWGHVINVEFYDYDALLSYDNDDNFGMFYSKIISMLK